MFRITVKYCLLLIRIFVNKYTWTFFLCYAYFQENGLAIVISDEGVWTLVKASAPNGPLSAGLPTMGMVNSRLASEVDTSLGTLKLSPKCLTASSTTPLGSSFQLAAAAANDFVLSSNQPEQCSVGVQVSLDFPCLVTSKEYAKSIFDPLETISTISSSHIGSKSFTTGIDGIPSVESSLSIESSPSQTNLPSSLYSCPKSDSSSSNVNKNSPRGSVALDSSVWSDEDDEFYDAVNSVSDHMSPKSQSSCHISFAGGEVPCSPVESPRNLVFDDCCELFESSVDDSPMTDILDESVRSGMCEDSIFGHLKVSSVDPVPNQVTSLANSLINDVYNSIVLDQDGNLHVHPIQTDNKYFTNNLDQNLKTAPQEICDGINKDAANNKEGDAMSIDSCNVSDSDEDYMPNFASLPANASDEEDQMDTDIEYLEDSHPCVKLVPKQGDSSCNELSTDEEILDDEPGESKEMFCSKVITSTPNKKMKKGYKYKTKSTVNTSVPSVSVNVSSKYSSYETSIGGDDSSDEEQCGFLAPQDLPVDLQPLPVDPVSDLKPEEQPHEVAFEQNSLKTLSRDVDVAEGNIPIIQPCDPCTSEVDNEKEADKLSPKILSCDPDVAKTLANERDTLSLEVLPSETAKDALTSEQFIPDPPITNQLSLDGHVTEEESGKMSPNVSLCESDTMTSFSGNVDNEKEPNKVTDEDLVGGDSCTTKPQDDIDVIDSKIEPDEISLKDDLGIVGDNLLKDNLSERDDVKDTVCDSELSISVQKDEEEKATSEDLEVEEVEGLSDSVLKANSGVCSVSLQQDVFERSIIDPNNNEREQDLFRKGLNSDTQTQPIACQSTENSSSSNDPSIQPAKDVALAIRAQNALSLIDDLESSDEDVEDGAQLKYTDDDLFEILDSPMHQPSNTNIRSCSPETLLSSPKLDDTLAVLHSNNGAGTNNNNETLGQNCHSYDPLSQNSAKGSDSQKNKKAAGSKKLFGHFKSWKKKGKGSKK